MEEVIGRVSAFPCRLVEVTGGEPLLQRKTPGLIKMMLDRCFEVLLETNGTRDIGSIDSRCVRIVDIKCPSSGEAEKNDFGNFSHLTSRDEIKFVMMDRRDYDYAVGILARYRDVCTAAKPPLFSPILGMLEPSVLAEWILNDGLPVRMQLQLQKIIWGQEVRGV